MGSISAELGTKSVELSEPGRVNLVELLSKYVLLAARNVLVCLLFNIQTMVKTGDSSGGVPIVVL